MTKTIPPSASRMTAGAAKAEALVALRDRLAKATGRDQMLDADIALAFGWTRDPEIKPYRWRSPEGMPELIPRMFTASLDAAVMLVPEGFSWTVTGGDQTATADINKWGEVSVRARASKPALALCLARIEYEIDNTPAPVDAAAEQVRVIAGTQSNPEGG